MTATSSDVVLLCAALDGGDDSALLPLADALEECGDTRAAGLRRAGWDEGRRPGRVELSVPQWGWRFGYGHAFCVSEAEAAALDAEPQRGGMIRWGDWRLYHTRSKAFLALAEVLAD